jgi:hypothetical protein
MYVGMVIDHSVPIGTNTVYGTYISAETRNAHKDFDSQQVKVED